MTTGHKRQIAVAASALATDPRQAIVQARRLGFDGLMFNVDHPELGLIDLSATGRREFVHLLHSHRQVLSALQVDLPERGLSPDADVDRILDLLDDALEAAAGVGRPVVCVDLGLLPAPAPSPPKPRVHPQDAGLIILPEFPSVEQVVPNSPAPDPSHVALVDQALREIGHRADRYGVVLGFTASLSPLASLDEALQRADCPWFGVNLDPTSVLQDQWSFEQTMDHLGRLIRHVRARDGLSGQSGRVQPARVGRGEVDWAVLLGLLDQADYGGILTLDPIDLPDRLSAAVAGLKHLRSHDSRP